MPAGVGTGAGSLQAALMSVVCVVETLSNSKVHQPSTISFIPPLVPDDDTSTPSFPFERRDPALIVLTPAP